MAKSHGDRCAGFWPHCSMEGIYDKMEGAWSFEVAGDRV